LESALASATTPFESDYTVTQFLADVNVVCPNAYTDAQKIIWINEGVRTLYPMIGVIDLYAVNTVANQYIYELPVDVDFDAIKSVTIGQDTEATGVVTSQIEYFPVFTDEQLKGRSYFKAVEGKIGFYPCPDVSDHKIRIWYQKKGADATTGASNIEVRKDYIPALKFFVMDKISVAQGDIAQANNFRNDYNAEIARLKMNRFAKDGKYPTTRNVAIKPRANARRKNAIGNYAVPGDGRLW
jgi:hypothetical protein